MTASSYPARRVHRRPDGRLDGPKLARAIHLHRMQGQRLPEIAQALNLPLSNVHYHMQPPEDFKETARLETLAELAAALKVHPANLRATVGRLELTPTPYGRHLLFNERDADAVRAYYAGHIDPHTAKTWLAIEDVSRMLHTCPETIRKNMKAGIEPYCRIRRARVLGASGNVWRYDPYTVAPLASSLPVRPLTPPRGSLTSKEVAEALGLNFKSVNMWAHLNSDAPALKTQHDLYYWPIPALVAWLKGRKPAHMRGYGRCLEGRYLTPPTVST